jgi:hypothetical protein
MKTSVLVVGSVLVSAAALGFAAGRAGTDQPARRQTMRVANAEIAADEHLTAVQQMPRTPDKVDEIATASFDGTYRMLKTATPEMLREWARELELIAVRPKRRAAITSFFRVLMQIDPTEARELMLGLNKENRTAALVAIKNAAPPRAMKQVLEVMLTYEQGELAGCSYNYVRDAIDDWSKADPPAVKQFIDEHPKSELESYYPALVRNWAAYDPEAAKEVVVAAIEAANARRASSEATTEELENDTNTIDYLVSSWVEGFLEHDRAAALDYVLATEHEGVDLALPWVLQALLVESPDEARAFMQRLPADRQVKAMSGVSVVSTPSVHGDADDVIRSPEFIANWMLQFPPDVWGESISNVVSQWRAKDATALFSWMSDLPADLKRRVAQSYTGYSGENEPGTELASVMALGDAELRDLLLPQLMTAAEYMRAPILAALEATQLPDEQKQYLASVIPHRPEPADDADEE